ncbi:MAG: type I 3-dehydroquinate dehydratase [Methanomicrobiaceae archaeon]|nr:type I 3-dehydroquinate dehydratase [Methanomicrobiaceae archaeon]
MKLVVSVPDLDALFRAVAAGADAIEVRLDLLPEPDHKGVRETLATIATPRIITLRSAAEGGAFRGTAEEWRERLEPWLAFADYVDIERPFAACADAIRGSGATIIASNHRTDMPDPAALRDLERELRGFGDLPKIIVAPACREDALLLLTFTATAKRPVATGVMGEKFRYLRAILPLFGSELVFCHAGTPTSPGQYHIDEMRQLLEMLR